MAEQQCFYEAQRKSRDLRRALYNQELCRPLGFPFVHRKTSCHSATLPESKGHWGQGYRQTPRDFLHHYDFNPILRPEGAPPYPEPAHKCLQKPLCLKSPELCKHQSLTQCTYLSLFPLMPFTLPHAIRSFSPALAAETKPSGFRNAHNGPNFSTTTAADNRTFRSPCSYMSNFQIVHTMVNLCPSKDTCTSSPGSVSWFRCRTSEGYKHDPAGVPELTDFEGQQMGLHGFKRLYECGRPSAPLPAICSSVCTSFCSSSTHHLAPPTRRIIYTSLPALSHKEPITPKPWRDPCGGRIYFRLRNKDLLQQWACAS